MKDDKEDLLPSSFLLHTSSFSSLSSPTALFLIIRAGGSLLASGQSPLAIRSGHLRPG
jgi:hypothetical protein